LLAQAVVLDLDSTSDRTTRAVLLQTAGVADLGLFRRGGPASAEPATALPPAAPTTLGERRRADPVIARIAALRSGDPPRVRHALADELPAELVGHAIPLLAWDPVLPDVVRALRGAAPRATGQLVDHLLDPNEEFAIRRRLPLVLATCTTDRAVDGLVRALADPRFEVRYRSGRALARLRQIEPGLGIDPARVESAVLREVAVDRAVWESHRLLDALDDESPVMDELLRDRASRSLEHVFTMLALVLPSQPLAIAFRGLHTDDAMLRGTALEWLESALPPAVRERLWPFLEDDRRRRPAARVRDDVLAELLHSSGSIADNLRARRAREEKQSGS
jgi:hypothetical protein